MISLKQIHYALAVEKTLHFKKAAEACSVSQSALSTALSELEKQLDIQIFERDNKKVLITPTGKMFLQRAQSIKLEVDSLYQLSQNQKAPLNHPMTVGVIPTVGPYLLPKVLPALRQQYPDFKLTIIEEQSHVLVDMIRKGEIDTAILALPYPHDGLLAFEFFQEDFYWLTRNDAEQSGLDEITSTEIDQSKLMLLKDGHCLKDHALAACKLSNNEQSETLGATSLNTLIQMVAGRMGSTLVPEMALKQINSQSDDLKAIHLNEPGPHRRIAFLSRPNYIGVKNIECLMEVFAEELR
ncbi:MULTISPECIES: hydrogen peroxide-inducible genes activator [unclassified Oleiphilus]|jgi:LysR family hydrogen peroxide-inducible transcriptional activator|nr:MULTISPECIES: hydrogen peroxide-inducible genes activator [unclassified Oleiphilus]KZY45733.1 LysR family transcriptional regulator [Oleiphilus sp. HI0050]KZY31460.1 LysR family transcriptional regulator [Oleiphilus sp. HI0043]KZZ31635.1 LysR family transcriptional regulator [Oleiphilus sp. HI0086]KZZ38267.1 LysR family transcriptional regulator [Oleiphilus sp. HI0117]KZZ63335.1 LysR family transcriptional regulator [Oleiphilus sp. HI0128]